MGRRVAPKPEGLPPIESEMLQADMDRIGKAADQEVAEFDEDRIAWDQASRLISAWDADIPDDEGALLRGGIQGLNISAVSLARTGLYFLKLRETHWRKCFVQKLAEHDIPQRQVYNAISVASAMLKLPKKSLQSIANFSGTHLIELAKLPQETLEEATESGLLFGDPLDKYSRMSVREMRAALREKDEQHAKDLEIKDRLLADSHKQRDTLATELHQLEGRTLPWDQRIAPMKDEMNLVSNVIDEAMGKLMLMHQAILNVDIDDDHRDLARRSLVLRYSEVLDRAATLIAECQGQADMELFGYIGGMREFQLQVPDQEAGE